jgi:hypothetical protein
MEAEKYGVNKFQPRQVPLIVWLRCISWASGAARKRERGTNGPWQPSPALEGAAASLGLPLPRPDVMSALYAALLGLASLFSPDAQTPILLTPLPTTRKDEEVRGDGEANPVEVRAFPQYLWLTAKSMSQWEPA